MTDKEFRRLSRAELIEIIYQLKKSEETLKAENAALRSKIADRRIKINNAGSIAEAALTLSGIFTIAQQTADLYVQNVCEMASSADAQAQQIITNAQWQAQQIIAQAEAESAAMRAAAGMPAQIMPQ